MPMTIAEYATDRGYSRPAIYKAIDRIPEMQGQTYQGVSNGKSAAFLTDEGVGILDANLQPSSKSNVALKKNLELALRSRETELMQEKAEKIEELTTKLADKTDELHREKEAEMTETRTMMMDRIDAIGSDVKETIATIKADYEEFRKKDQEKFHEQYDKLKSKYERVKSENEALRTEIEEKDKEIDRLKGRLSHADALIKALGERFTEVREHPFRNLMDRPKTGKFSRPEIEVIERMVENGESAEDN